MESKILDTPAPRSFSDFSAEIIAGVEPIITEMGAKAFELGYTTGFDFPGLRPHLVELVFNSSRVNVEGLVSVEHLRTELLKDNPEREPYYKAKIAYLHIQYAQGAAEGLADNAEFLTGVHVVASRTWISDKAGITSPQDFAQSIFLSARLEDLNPSLYKYDNVFPSRQKPSTPVVKPAAKKPGFFAGLLGGKPVAET